MRKKYSSTAIFEPKLEQLFGSRTRLRLLKLFFNNPDKFHYIREITRETGIQINSIRRELENLQNLGIITELTSELDNNLGQNAKRSRTKVEPRQKKKYFKVNYDFLLYQELKSLLLKSQLLLEKNLIKGIQKLGTIYYLALTGFFVGQKDGRTDILLVGKLNRKKLKMLIKSFEKEFGREINYTVFSKKEFNYRKDITDRFLYDILENNKIVVINKIV